MQRLSGRGDGVKLTVTSEGRRALAPGAMKNCRLTIAL